MIAGKCVLCIHFQFVPLLSISVCCTTLGSIPESTPKSLRQNVWILHVHFLLQALSHPAWLSGSLILWPELRDAIACPSSLFWPVGPHLLYHTLPLVETAHLPFHLPGPVSSPLLLGFSAAYKAKEMSYLRHVIFSRPPSMSLPA